MASDSLYRLCSRAEQDRFKLCPRKESLTQSLRWFGMGAKERAEGRLEEQCGSIGVSSTPPHRRDVSTPSTSAVPWTFPNNSHVSAAAAVVPARKSLARFLFLTRGGALSGQERNLRRHVHLPDTVSPPGMTLSMRSV
ncbi:hypothetical protein ISCGN_018179 [Ixodes scapularis]